MRLRADGVSNLALLKAVEATPREQFVSKAYADFVWSDRTIPLECGSFLEGADTMVKLLNLLDLKEGQRVLDIGTGSGFTAAVMARICERVLSIDRYRTLAESARRRLSKMGLTNIVTRQADGSRKLSGEGTFDRIFVSAAFDSMPRMFTEHLVSEGIMLAPMLREDGSVVMARFVKIGSRFDREDLFDIAYLPLASGLASTL
ncbi:protein-L-isoaspartate(D-aspartate) O-methyltransferase [Rhizobium sp. L1K21]|nr:protein-L-isoaspartate(D-aspartate) O-methyltransferase [Rhizobium sp. L1K21]